MKNNSRRFFFVKDFLLESLRENRIKTIIIFSFSLAMFIIGIIVAITTGPSNPDNIFGFALKEGTFKIITSSFFSRLLSLIVIFALLCLLSFCKYLFPIGVLIIAYRAYLLGLNICFMIILYGLSGVILSLFIIIPCHILAIIILCLFYILILRTRKDYCNFWGYRMPKQRSILFLFFFLSIFLVCLIESLLLLLLSANVILVI